MSLFGQALFGARGGADEGFMMVMIVVVLVAIAIGLAIGICYFLTLSKALSRCQPENRTMEPGMVWLNLIPLFGIVWIFITVNRIAESLQNEFESRGWGKRGENYAKNLGISYLCLSFAGIIPFIGPVFSIASLICFILYWVKIAGYSSQLATKGDYAPEYDDQPREPRRPAKRREDDNNW